MTPRLQALHAPPITFAHRGARANAAENTLEAFRLALDLGAKGLESDVWLTADGVPVLDHDGVAGGRLRRRRLRDLLRDELPHHIPSLEDLYASCGTSMQLSLDVKDPAAFGPTVDVARAAGAGALERLWLCHPDWHQVADWRDRLTGGDTAVDTDATDDGCPPSGRRQLQRVHLVDSTRLKLMREGPERRAAALARAGIDAVNLHHSDWTGGLTTLFHRFGVLAFGWDAQLPRVLDELLDIGIDAVYSDHVDRMTASLSTAYG